MTGRGLTPHYRMSPREGRLCPQDPPKAPQRSRSMRSSRPVGKVLPSELTSMHPRVQNADLVRGSCSRIGCNFILLLHDLTVQEAILQLAAELLLDEGNASGAARCNKCVSCCFLWASC